MAGTCEDALGALAAHLGLPLEFKDGSCSFNVGGQPFTITNDDELDRLVVSALVADDLPDAPSRKLMTDLLDLGFGMMHEGLPAVRSRNGLHRRFRGLSLLAARRGGVPRRVHEVRVLRRAPRRAPRDGAGRAAVRTVHGFGRLPLRHAFKRIFSCVTFSRIVCIQVVGRPRYAWECK